MSRVAALCIIYLGIACTLATGRALRAEELHFGEPTLQAGSGVEAGTHRSDADIYATISISGVDGTILKHLDAVYGRASVTVNFPAGHSGSIPYLDLNFTSMIAGRTDEEGENLGLRLGTVHVSRSIPIGERLALRVDLFGTQAGLQKPLKLEYDPRWIAFLNLTVDMLGIKSVDRVRSSDSFIGANLSSLKFEGGLEFKVNQYLNVRALLGLEADWNIGDRNRNVALYSGSDFYAKFAVDVQDFSETFRLSAFARGGIDAAIETGAFPQTQVRVISGLMLSE